MGIEYKDFTQERLSELQPLLTANFGEEVMASLQKILDNPLLTASSSAGCIGYRDSQPVCFKAFMLRRVFFGQEAVLGLVGGFFCKAKKGCPLPVIIEVQERTEWNKNGCRFRFGNTCIYATMRLNAKLGAKPGPVSWSEMRFGIIRPISLIAHILRRKLFKRPQSSGDGRCPLPENNGKIYVTEGKYTIRRLVRVDELWGQFWQKYLAENKGIVVSRDQETMNWIFGKEIADGTCVALGLFAEENRLAGYIILRPMRGSARRWQIFDMIALNNSKELLKLLLKGARSFLKHDTSAMTLESTGFSDWVQPVLKSCLPFCRKTGHNRFEMLADDPELITRLEEQGNREESWFFGPFDGDYFL